MLCACFSHFLSFCVSYLRSNPVFGCGVAIVAEGLLDRSGVRAIQLCVSFDASSTVAGREWEVQVKPPAPRPPPAPRCPPPGMLT